MARVKAASLDDALPRCIKPSGHNNGSIFCMCSKARFVLLVFVMLCLTHSRAQAQLRWEESEVTLHPAPGEQSVSTNFKFANAGSTEITISKVETSCGCTTAKLDKQTYQAQESGALQVTFTFAGRVGWQHKEIAVQTTDPRVPATLLKLHAFVPDPIQTSASGVKWEVGETCTPKTIRVNVSDPGLTITGAVCADKQFRCNLQTLEAGKSYQLTVTPLSTAQANSAFVQLNTSSHDRPVVHLQASVSDP